MLKCFGRNDFGQLGLKHNNSQFGVATIQFFPNISSIHCGAYHTFILTGKKNIKINKYYILFHFLYIFINFFFN